MAVVRVGQSLHMSFGMRCAFTSGIEGAIRQFEKAGGVLDPHARHVLRVARKELEVAIHESGYRLLSLPNDMTSGDAFRFLWRNRCSSANVWELIALAVTRDGYFDEDCRIAVLERMIVAGNVPPQTPLVEVSRESIRMRMMNFSRTWPKGTKILTRQGY